MASWWSQLENETRDALYFPSTKDMFYLTCPVIWSKPLKWTIEIEIRNSPRLRSIYINNPLQRLDQVGSPMKLMFVNAKFKANPQVSSDQRSPPHHYAMCLILDWQLHLPPVCASKDLDLLKLPRLKFEGTVSGSKPFEKTRQMCQTVDGQYQLNSL